MIITNISYFHYHKHERMGKFEAQNIRNGLGLILELINPIVFQIDFVKIKLYTPNGRLFPHLISTQPEYREDRSNLS